MIPKPVCLWHQIQLKLANISSMFMLQSRNSSIALNGPLFLLVTSILIFYYCNSNLVTWWGYISLLDGAHLCPFQSALLLQLEAYSSALTVPQLHGACLMGEYLVCICVDLLTVVLADGFTSWFKTWTCATKI